MNTTTGDKPLWKVLNEKRTQGEWMLAENHLPDNHYTQSVLSLGSTLVADFIRHNFKKVGKSKFKNKNKLHPCEASLANAQYTSLAVNNLHLLAEALEKIFNIEDGAFGLKGFDVTRLKSEIQEALKRIS